MNDVCAQGSTIDTPGSVGEYQEVNNGATFLGWEVRIEMTCESKSKMR